MGSSEITIFKIMFDLLPCQIYANNYTFELKSGVYNASNIVIIKQRCLVQHSPFTISCPAARN
ncbi:hypothetical protein HanRHA438_Chr07g0293991 [Helianthus annuus]|nr:hypothetical protein HanRHA438_Chr07g0293991 [Helianthus annuus]